MKRAISFVIVILSLFLLWNQVRGTEHHVSNCGSVPTAPNDIIYLDNDIIDSSYAICFNIISSNTTLDCQGHLIDGTFALGEPEMDGIHSNQNNTIIRNCTLTDWESAISFDNSKNSLIERINVTNNFLNGISVLNSNNFILRDIIGRGNGVNIDIWGSNNIKVSNVESSFADLEGIGVTDSQNVEINNVSSYSSDGILFDGSINCNLENANSSFNNYGVGIYSGSKNISLKNIVASNNYDSGIYIAGGFNNTISNSVISNNHYGIEFDYNIWYNTEYNLIFNNLFNNTQNVFFNPYGSVKYQYWNTTHQTGSRIYSRGTLIGGNYWTNPSGTGFSDTCVDVGKDGFCDEYYNTSWYLSNFNIDYLAYSSKYQGVNLSDGSPCAINEECLGGYCVHNICRSKPTYCGDTYCDSGESCSSCSNDCKCPGSAGCCGNYCGCPSNYYCSNNVCKPEDGNDGGPTCPSNFSITIGRDKVNLTVVCMLSGTIRNFTIPSTSFFNFTFGVNTTVRNFNIIIERIPEDSIDLRPKLEKTIYSYIVVSRLNINESDIKDVQIGFMVEKSWITNNDINISTISFYRYTNYWNQLSINRIGEDPSYIFYNTESPGTSIFAIAAEKNYNYTPTCPPCSNCTEWSECLNNQRGRTCYYCNSSTNYVCVGSDEVEKCGIIIPYYVYYLLILSVAIVVIVLTFLLLHKFNIIHAEPKCSICGTRMKPKYKGRFVNEYTCPKCGYTITKQKK